MPRTYTFTAMAEIDGAEFGKAIRILWSLLPRL
jgi:hypothetical protein